MQQLRFIWMSAFLLFSISSLAQSTKRLISGPWAGNVEMRTATIWVEVTAAVQTVSVSYYPEGKKNEMQTVRTINQPDRDFYPVKINLTGLQFGTRYIYIVALDDQPVSTSFETAFTTKDLWQHRKPAPDFSFLAGSCAYFNEPVFDRPGKPYGGDSSIFSSMAKEKAAFHIWMGDNWYTREADYGSVWGLNYRASRDRSLPVLQPFMAAMPQYSIWDDHDYGPNDAGKSFIHKQQSRDIFQSYSLNPSYGENGQGIYTVFSYSDADFFLTDDRYFRAEDDWADSIGGKPNPAKTFFGSQQLDWLKNALLYSKATFKVIVVGSQVLNPVNRFECMRHFPSEWQELMQFLDEYPIKGVVFFSGDRHHSEVIRWPRPNNYALLDVTISPYTSGVSKPTCEEANNPYREPNTLIEQQNYGRIRIAGAKGNRVMTIEWVGTRGEKLGEYAISESALKTK